MGCLCAAETSKPEVSSQQHKGTVVKTHSLLLTEAGEETPAVFTTNIMAAHIYTTLNTPVLNTVASDSLTAEITGERVSNWQQVTEGSLQQPASRCQAIELGEEIRVGSAFEVMMQKRHFIGEKLGVSSEMEFPGKPEGIGDQHKYCVTSCVAACWLNRRQRARVSLWSTALDHV